MYTHIAIRTKARPQVRQQFIPLLASPSVSSCSKFNHSTLSSAIQHKTLNSVYEARHHAKLTNKQQIEQLPRRKRKENHNSPLRLFVFLCDRRKCNRESTQKRNINKPRGLTTKTMSRRRAEAPPPTVRSAARSAASGCSALINEGLASGTIATAQEIIVASAYNV